MKFIEVRRRGGGRGLLSTITGRTSLTVRLQLVWHGSHSLGCDLSPAGQDFKKVGLRVKPSWGTRADPRWGLKAKLGHNGQCQNLIGFIWWPLRTPAILYMLLKFYTFCSGLLLQWSPYPTDSSQWACRAVFSASSLCTSRHRTADRRSPLA